MIKMQKSSHYVSPPKVIQFQIHIVQFYILFTVLAREREHSF